MNNVFKSGLVALCLASAGAANAQTTILAKVQTAHDLRPLEAAAAIVIGDALGLKLDYLVMTSRNTKESFGVLGPAIVISRNCDHDLNYVLRNKPKGEGWGNVAKKMGMHPGTFNKMRVQGGSFESMCWMNMLNTKYRFPQKDYERAQKQGLSDLEIVLAVVKADGKAASFDKAMKEVVASRPKKAGGPPSNAGGGKGRGKGGGHQVTWPRE
jgi:hypothetical protein